jgi:hypothetical protein
MKSKILIVIIALVGIISCQENTSQIKLIEKENFEQVIEGKQFAL